ncbi:hypothetical protein [Nocardia macrotermitis]|uniref:Uncharacterized protein n=1 Tax=Nocardia macrotermitis TaxID=2585198 RepID=A0A7K0D2S3_9NOCA|nr:hypothetical protein [Nocardia macrotermitis]MQY20019.1 hypothetical protein [Nocardia macrotermitis]
MFHRQSVRTLIIALSGGVILTCGVATAVAAPQPKPEFPLGTQHESPAQPGPGDLGDQAEKAQDLGGDIVTRIIDMGADLTKCGLNLITPSVACK